MNDSAEILIEEDEANSNESMGFDFSYISNNQEKEKQQFKLTQYYQKLKEWSRHIFLQASPETSKTRLRHGESGFSTRFGCGARISLRAWRDRRRASEQW